MTLDRTSLLILLHLLPGSVFGGGKDLGTSAPCKASSAGSSACSALPARPRGPTIQAALQEINGAGQEERLQMLQVRGAIARSSASPDAPSRKLKEVLPVAWVHVPKCGSSFLNSIVHMPGVCPSYDDDLVIDRMHFGGAFLDAFKSSHNMTSECPGMVHTSLGHEGIEENPTWETGKGHFMVMLRQPEQRLMSAHSDMMGAFTDYWTSPVGEMPDKLAYINRTDRSWGGWPSSHAPSVREFAQYASGCATRMLVRDGWPCGGSGGPPTADEMEEAKRRLREGFSFVGITDQWALSMCLLDKMYKVGCHAYQFHDSRPGADKKAGSDTYPTWPLLGYKDPYDGELYEEAVKIFEESLKRHDVSEETCKPCFDQAGVSLISARTEVLYQDQRHEVD